MDEQNKSEPENNKPGFFKRLFEDLYEVTVIDSKNRKHVFMMKEITFKGENVEELYNLIVKIQKQYLSLNKEYS